MKMGDLLETIEERDLRALVERGRPGVTGNTHCEIGFCDYPVKYHLFWFDDDGFEFVHLCHKHFKDYLRGRKNARVAQR